MEKITGRIDKKKNKGIKNYSSSNELSIRNLYCPVASCITSRCYKGESQDDFNIIIEVKNGNTI